LNTIGINSHPFLFGGETYSFLLSTKPASFIISALEGGAKIMRTNVKIAILETIKNNTEHLDPHYFWSSPAVISGCLEQLFSIEVLPATVSKYLKKLRDTGYLTSFWGESSSPGNPFTKKPLNLEITAKATEYLELCKADQKIHH